MKRDPVSESVRELIRDIPDFPKPGIIFKDITPVLHHAKIFPAMVRTFVRRYAKKRIDLVAAIESRGFILGAPIALALGVGFVPIRKKGKLPHRKITASFTLEYGSAEMEIHEDAVRKGQRVLMVDDLLATGGTMEAACRLVEQLGGKVAGCAFIVELDFLKGCDKLKGYDNFSLVHYL